MDKSNTHAGLKDLNVLLIRAYEIAQMSLLTLVYRAAPRLATSSIFNGQCIEKARATLERLHGFLELTQNETGCLPTHVYQ